ncbi:MAG: ABC transporter substrate-binding protein [Bacteroidota bacterium]|nr:ABC transporter substrate-binding protein [Bacteroidota bacterium]
MLKLQHFIPVFIFFALACSDASKKTAKTTSETNSYAQLFDIDSSETQTTITVYTESGDAGTTFQQAKFGKDNGNSRQNYIPKSINRIVCLSTTHIGFLKKLNYADKIVGIAGQNNVFDESIQKRIQQNKVADVGYEGNLNWERIIELQPDLITSYQIPGVQTKTVEMAKRFGIPYIIINEFSEPDILGQAEWIKVFGALTGSKKRADALFNQIALRYNNLKQSVKQADKRPTVFTNMPWKGTWYVPGGKSNISKLINDAGGKYLWESEKYSGSKPKSIEQIFITAENADYWLNPGQATKYSDIENTDSRLVGLKCYRTGKVYNRTARVGSSGGNDYMESGVVNPDKVLSDLIQILHPELSDGYLYYYEPLK